MFQIEYEIDQTVDLEAHPFIAHTFEDRSTTTKSNNIAIDYDEEDYTMDDEEEGYIYYDDEEEAIQTATEPVISYYSEDDIQTTTEEYHSCCDDYEDTRDVFYMMDHASVDWNTYDINNLIF